MADWRVVYEKRWACWSRFAAGVEGGCSMTIIDRNRTTSSAWYTHPLPPLRLLQPHAHLHSQPSSSPSSSAFQLAAPTRDTLVPRLSELRVIWRGSAAEEVAEEVAEVERWDHMGHCGDGWGHNDRSKRYQEASVHSDFRKPIHQLQKTQTSTCSCTVGTRSWEGPHQNLAQAGLQEKRDSHTSSHGFESQTLGQISWSCSFLSVSSAPMVLQWNTR